MSSNPQNVSPEEEKQIRGKKKVLVLAVIGAIAISLIISWSSWYPKTEKVEDLASDFSMVDIDGNNFTLTVIWVGLLY